MKIKFNENTLLLGLAVVTFLAGAFTIGITNTLLVMLALVTITILLTNLDFFKKKNKRANIKKKINEVKTRGKRYVKGKGKMNWFRLSGLIILGLFVLGITLGLLMFIWVAITAPKFDPKELYAREQTILYDKDGNTFATLGSEKREKISYNQLPQVLVDAIVATEDSRFFQHNGFDLPRFIKAALGQATGNSDAGGASTLDMQIAKNAFTSTKVSITRKFTDIYLSIFKIERKYSKEEIFEFYVNTPFLGSNSYGVQQASRTYFGKDVKDLTLSESAIIAGLFQSPSAYNPYSYPERTEKRRSTVLKLMERHGYITKADRVLAESIPVTSLLTSTKPADVKYQGYIDTAVEEVIARTEHNPYNVSMLIYTNLDQKKQTHIDDIMSGKTYTWDNDKVQAGATVININTGAIEAVAAGRNRQGERSFNFATMLRRQPGSTAKPLFDYGPGIEYENWSTYTPFVDEPHTYSDGGSIKNWDSQYMGFMTLRRAIMFSRNIPALKAFQANKNSNVVEFVKKLGLHPEITKDGFLHEAHAVGGYNGESPTSLIGAFAAFGNGGFYIKPYAVSKIEYRETGKVVNMKSEKTRAMSDSTAYMITDVLVSTVTGGLSGRQNIPGIQVAAKTGTTNFDAETKRRYGLPGGAINDLWECAYTPDTGICIWYGYPKIDKTAYNKSNDGGKRSALLRAINNGIFEKTGKTFTMPDSVVRLNVVPGSNPPALATDGGGVSELFKKGFEPSDTGSTSLTDVTNLTGSFISASNSVKLSWSHVNDMAKILETYQNVPDIGKLGYNLYVNDGSGYKSIGFTEDNNYTYALTGSYVSLDFMVKTTFSGSKTLTSPGANVTVDIGTASTITVNLNGNSIVNVSVGDPAKTWWNNDATTGVIVMDGTKDVTNDSATQITRTSVPEFNPDIKAEYKITYNISYKGVSKKEWSKTRTVKVQ